MVFSVIIFDAAGDDGKKGVEERDESLDNPIVQIVQKPSKKMCTRRANSQMHDIKNATHKQFPFVAAIMSEQDKHLCTGTVVSNGLILTTAQCTQKPINYVLINATKAKKDDTTVVLHIIKTEKYPNFATTESETDVGLIYTKKHNETVATKIWLSNSTSPRALVDMEIIGFGLNAEVSQTRVLQYVGVGNQLVTVQPTVFKGELTAYLDCVDTEVPTCFKDTGGPSIFADELVGIVTKGDDECFNVRTDSGNKTMAEILPVYTFRAWLLERIEKNEVQDQVVLETFPTDPVEVRRRARRPAKKRRKNSSVACPQVSRILFLVIFLDVNTLF